MVTNADGRLSDRIIIPDAVAKMGGGRSIPMHPELRSAFRRLFKQQREGPVIRSITTDRALLPNSVVNWFVELYREVGATGCSSHSGRRTFITYAARLASKAGASLRDVQQLAGHKSIEVTQGYIDGDSQAQHRLVRSL